MASHFFVLKEEVHIGGLVYANKKAVMIFIHKQLSFLVIFCFSGLILILAQNLARGLVDHTIDFYYLFNIHRSKVILCKID